uniref:Enoyl-CoA hydratase domain-containing protein 3, mitochondrial n=1 Tax=Acrobeloides nanus TaxID=290746 RepID=A0A914C0M1_9BILA
MRGQQFSTSREIYLENQVVRLVLNSTKKRNALSSELMSELLRELEGINKIPKVRAVIMAGNGPAFSAGHDLKELASETGAEFIKEVFAKATKLMTFIQQMELPVIAEVDGVAAAAGIQLVASCDIVVASSTSTFSTPGIKAGIFCSTPGIPLVRNVPRKIAMDMLLTARVLNADEALRYGLVSRVVSSSEVRHEAIRVAEEITKMSRSITSIGKAFFYTQVDLPQNQAFRFGESVMVENLKMVDSQEGIKSFVEKRSPEWTHSDKKV